MPLATILILEGRPEHQRVELARAVTTAIAQSLDAKPETIRVIVQEIAKEHWSVGGKTMKELGR
jgi:4-oxalocrotonate tautomerase